MYGSDGSAALAFSAAISFGRAFLPRKNFRALRQESKYRRCFSPSHSCSAQNLDLPRPSIGLRQTSHSGLNRQPGLHGGGGGGPPARSRSLYTSSTILMKERESSASPR